jgi:probable HAF family extracellular repeat protein
VQRAMSVLCPMVVVSVALTACSSATAPKATSTNDLASNTPGAKSAAVAVLPSLSRPNSCAQGVADAGTAVGESEGSDFNLHAVSWTGGSVSDLGTLGGPTSTANAISYRGTVVGSSVNHAGMIHAFAAVPGAAMVDLGDLGGGFSSALAVNNWGIVVGSSTDAASVSHAFVWSATGGMHALTPSSAECVATGINDSGVVVGDCTNGSGVTTAFIVTVLNEFIPSRAQRVATLSGLGGTFSVAWGINVLGEIVGESATPDGIHHAVRWALDGSVHQLGGAPAGEPSFAYAVNTEGTVAGAIADASGALHATQWSVTGTPTALGDASNVSSMAFGIDSRGGVVGCGADANANEEALWWGNGAPASSAASVLALAPSAHAGRTAGPFDYGYAPSSSMVQRFGLHAGSPSAMRVLRFGHASME